MATAQHVLGMVHLELEEFDQAQKHLQNSSATYRAVYGVKDKNTMGAHLGIAMAARLAGNLQQAKEILETAEDSLLGNKHTCLNLYTRVLADCKQDAEHCNHCVVICSVVGLTWKYVMLLIPIHIIMHM